MSETRKCKSCGKEDEKSNFPSAGTIKGKKYFRMKCMDCWKKVTYEWKVKERNKFKKYKKTLSCNRCPVNDHRVLEFHHTDSNKEANVGSIVGKKTFLNLKKEIDKCEVLCANCHRIEHSKEELLD